MAAAAVAPDALHDTVRAVLGDARDEVRAMLDGVRDCALNAEQFADVLCTLARMGVCGRAFVARYSGAEPQTVINETLIARDALLLGAAGAAGPTAVDEFLDTLDAWYETPEFYAECATAQREKAVFARVVRKVHRAIRSTLVLPEPASDAEAAAQLVTCVLVRHESIVRMLERALATCSTCGSASPEAASAAAAPPRTREQWRAALRRLTNHMLACATRLERETWLARASTVL